MARVIVVWRTSDPEVFGVLSHRDGPRIYERDEQDTRCGDLPYYRTLKELASGQEVGSQHAAQLDLRSAVANGLV